MCYCQIGCFRLCVRPSVCVCACRMQILPPYVNPLPGALSSSVGVGLLVYAGPPPPPPPPHISPRVLCAQRRAATHNVFVRATSSSFPPREGHCAGVRRLLSSHLPAHTHTPSHMHTCTHTHTLSQALALCLSSCSHLHISPECLH